MALQILDLEPPFKVICNSISFMCNILEDFSINSNS